MNQRTVYIIMSGVIVISLIAWGMFAAGARWKPEMVISNSALSGTSSAAVPQGQTAQEYGYAKTLYAGIADGDVSSQQCASAANTLEQTYVENTYAVPGNTEDMMQYAYLFNKHRCIASVAGGGPSADSAYWGIVDVITQDELYWCDTTGCYSKISNPPSYFAVGDIFDDMKQLGGY